MENTTQVQSPIDWQSINEYVRETSRQIREMKERFEEADRRFKEQLSEMEAKRAKEQAEMEAKRAKEQAEREAKRAKEEAERTAQREKEYKELRQMFQETDRQFKETAQQWKETDRRFKRADQRMKQLDELFTGQWGKLMEALMAPAALKLFQDLGIGITHIHQDSRHRKANDHEIEVDLMLVNSNVLVAVEVKTTCRKEDIDHFLKQMEHFKELFTEFKNYTVYPAVAAIKYNNYSDIYARRQGMFVLRTSGDGVLSLDALPKEQWRKY